MIKHTQKIEINSDLNKVWFFLMNFSHSLIFDKYYTKIELPFNYSVNKNLIFKIYINYFFMLQQYNAKVKECLPPESFILNIKNVRGVGYQHQKSFSLQKKGSKTLLTYKHSGSFDYFILDLFFFIFLKSSCLNELKHIKQSIESSEINLNDKKYNTMKL